MLSWDLDGGFISAEPVRNLLLTIRCEYPDTNMAHKIGSQPPRLVAISDGRRKAGDPIDRIREGPDPRNCRPIRLIGPKREWASRGLSTRCEEA